MRPLVFVALVVVLAFSSQARARPEATARQIAKCARIDDALKRLECFDELATKLGVSRPAKRESKAGAWRINESVSPLDDSRTVAATLDANEPISGWPRKTYVPSLILRCMEGQLSAFIVTGMSPSVEDASETATVTLRLDKEEAFELKTSKSTDGEALFFGSASSIIDLIGRHERMLFRFVPFNSSPVLTSFTLIGAGEVTERVREACRAQPTDQEASARPRLKLGNVTAASSTFDPNVAWLHLRDRSLLFEPCYEGASALARGNLVLDVTLDGSGTATEVKTASDTIRFEAGAQCVRGLLKQMLFPAPPDAPTTFNVSFTVGAGASE